MFTQPQLTFGPLRWTLLPSKSHFDFQWSLINLERIQNVHVFHFRVALCILCITWNLTWELGLPVPKLYRGASSRMSNSHSGMSRNSEGAGLWLLSRVCPAGRGALWCLHAEVLRCPEVLPRHGLWITFAAAHPRFRTMWTTGGLGCDDKSGPAGYKW